MQDMTQQEHQEAGAHREGTVARHTFKSGPSASGVALPAGKGPDGHSGEEARDASAASRPPAAVRSTDGIAARTKQVRQAPRARFPWELAPFEFRYSLCRKSGPSRHHGRCCPAHQVAAGTTHEASLPNLASTIAGAPSELPDSDMEMTAQESELRAPTPEETTAAAGRPEPTSPLTGGPSAAALRGEGVGSSEAGHSSPPTPTAGDMSDEEWQCVICLEPVLGWKAAQCWAGSVSSVCPCCAVISRNHDGALREASPLATGDTTPSGEAHTYQLTEARAYQLAQLSGLPWAVASCSRSW